MKVLDLFSGIGGFSLGLERAGMETIAFCEIEPFCQQVLKQHWPEVPIFNDIRNLSADELPEKPELICGGYPCQPFSVAGKQRGQEDDRHLWPEMFRLIKECRPAWVIAENVAGHIRLGLDSVLFDLESAGYRSQPFVIPACGLNAPHKRDRIWIVANAPGERVQGYGTGGEQIPHPYEKASLPGRSRQRSWETQWQAEPGMGRVVDGISHRVDRVKALGNSVVSQIPEILGHTILKAESEWSRKKNTKP